MLKKILLKGIAAALLLQATPVIAKESTAVEAFIYRVKETNTFRTVSDIWVADNNFDKTELLKNVEKAQPLSIDYMRLAMFMKEKSTAINLVLPGEDGTTFTVELARYDMLANDFKVQEMGENNVEKPAAYTPGLYYRGVVKGIEGSVASFSFFNNEVYGFFSIPGIGNYVVTPNTMVGKSYDYNPHYLLYNDGDLKIKDRAPLCHTDELPFREVSRPANKTTTTLNNKSYNSCKEIRFFFNADYSMYVKKGSSTTNSTNYITSLFNNISTLYKNEGIMIILGYVQVNTATDAYQSLALSSGRWLRKFGGVTQNVMHGCDLAMLLTTKGGSMGGVAWLGVLCDSWHPWDSSGPYAFCNIDNSSTLTTTAFPTYSWDVSATTHEMGHNLGSPHTHACCWNPPARNTAIDGCATIEGSCPDPGNPTSAVKGTIMSYCHLLSVGVSFSNGFGPQPGDTMRYTVRTSGGGCGNLYNPNAPLAIANRTLSANKECTDLTTGITYYFKDNNTASHTDDTLVMMLRKNGNNIGDLNNTAFSVKTTTLTGYAGGTGVTTTFPTGTAGVAGAGNNFAMRRYWSVTPVGSTAMTTPVEVFFPFMPADTTDVNGSVPGASAPMANYKVFKVHGTIDPNPANNFPTATASNISVYPFGTSLSTTNWVLTPTGGGGIYATFKVTNLAGGGGMFYPNGVTSTVSDLTGTSGIEIFPNPTNTDWFISLIENNGAAVSLQLYSADGRVTKTQTLTAGTTNTIEAANLPAGMYFYRIISGGNVYTGNLMKN